jgi:hypothetical protein
MLTQGASECLTDNDEVWLSFAEAKIWIGCDAQKIDSMIADGTLPAKVLSPQLLPVFPASIVSRIASERSRTAGRG